MWKRFLNWLDRITPLSDHKYHRAVDRLVREMSVPLFLAHKKEIALPKRVVEIYTGSPVNRRRKIVIYGLKIKIY